MHILNTLGPVFLVILIGFLLARFGFLEAHATKVINWCCYWVGLPCLLLLKIGTAPGVGVAARDTTLVVLYATLLLAAIACLVGWFLRLESRSLATFVHVGFRGNLAYVALPIVCYAFVGTEHEEAAEASASIVLGVTVVLYNVMAVVLHLLSTHRLGWRALERMAVKLTGNPLVLACAAGLAWNRWVHSQGVAIPVMIERAMVMLGQFALPMALLCVGATLAVTPVRSLAGGAFIVAILKTAAGPLVAIGVSRFMGMGPMETGIACIMLGAPSAVAAYVLTEQLDGDPPLAAASIVTSVILCAGTLSAVLAWIV